MARGRRVRSVIAGLLLCAGVLSVVAQASPIVRPGGSREDSGAGYDSERLTSIVGEVVQEVRRSGPGISPGLLGIDDGFPNSGGLLYSEVRDQSFIALVGSRSVSTGIAGPDLFRDTLDAALRSTREAFFDGSDTANFSLVGIELSVTLRGERRGVSVNGFDLLASNSDKVEVLPLTSSLTGTANASAAGADTVVVRQDADGRVTVADIRKFVFHPMTVIGVIVLVGIWAVIVVAYSARSRNT